MSITTKNDVVSINAPITRQQAYKNSYYAIGYLLAHNYATLEAACAMMGNSIHEINCNPGASQGWREPPDPTKGFGILQWTPCSRKIFAYALNFGLPRWDMDTQLEYIWWQATTEPQNGYIPHEGYETPHSYPTFLRSHMNVDYLARAFCINAEKYDATQKSLDRRAAHAVYLYDLCQNDMPEWVDISKRGMPLYMMYVAITGGC